MKARKKEMRNKERKRKKGTRKKKEKLCHDSENKKINC